tara:strand:+ start:55497 stop:57026 length:1530 start_codon:yes stop_codon:yes gene_type:complete
MFVLFTAMAQFASFAIIQHHVVSFFGAQSEDISLAFQMTYVGILGTLPLQFRFQERFEIRNYLLFALVFGLLLNIGCLVTKDLIIFTILRFFVGITTCMVAGCMLITLFSTLPESKKNVVGVGLFFGTLLSVGIIVGIAAAWFVERMNWNALYYFLIVLQLISILFCFVLFKEKTASRKIPLYQLDYIGFVFFVSFGFLLAYVFIYGPKYYWFHDSRIRWATVFGFVFLFLFLKQQFQLKRPSIDLRVFQHKRFLFGLFLLMVFFGIKDTINLLYGYAAGILGWSASDIVSLGLFNVIGVVISSILAVKVVLSKKQNLPKLLFIGFGMLLYYHLWMYWNLTPNLSYANLIFPIILQGLASGLLFAPIIMLCVSSLPSFTGMTGVIVCAYCRFVISLNSIAGFYTLQENYNQEFKIGFIEGLTPFNPRLTERIQNYKSLLIAKGISVEEASYIANKLVGKTVGIQSQILTNRTIFILSVYLIIATLISLMLFAIFNKYHLKKKISMEHTI